MTDDSDTTGSEAPDGAEPIEENTEESDQALTVGTIRRVVLTGTLTILGIIAAVVLALRLRGFLYLVFMALFISVALEPAVQWLVKRNWNRRRATMVVFVGWIILALGFVAALVPVIAGQAASLVESFPDLLESIAPPLQDWFGVELDTEQLNRDLSSAGSIFRRFGEQVGGGVLAVGQTLVGGVINAVTIALFAFFMIADGPTLRTTLLSVLTPERQGEALKIWEIAVEKTGGYVYSRFLLAVVSAVFHALAFGFLGLPFPVPLGIGMGVLSQVIPVVGTYLGGALPILVAVATGPVSVLWVLLAIVVYQQLENFILAPRVTRHTMEMHPAVSVGAILIGGTLMGVSGVVASLPVAAIVQAVISTSVERHAVLDEPVEES